MKLLKISLILLLFVACKYQGSQDINSEISVVVNFGKEKGQQTIPVKWKQDMTALEALQYTYKTETHPVGKYVFVTSIDSVKGKRGAMAWYYTVNGEPTNTLAINYTLNYGDTLTWNYTKDVCSQKVDNRK